MAEPRRGLPRVSGGEPAAAPPEPAPGPPQPRRGLPRAGAEPAESAPIAPAVARPQPAEAPAPADARVPGSERRPSRYRRDEILGALTVLLLVGLALLIAAAAVVFMVRIFLFESQAGADFLAAFPGETPLPDWAPVGFPLWLQWQHWLNAFFIVLVVKTGWSVRTTTRPVAMWQRRSGRGRKMSIELWTHLSLDVLWLANGVVFWILLFVTGQWVRVVPTSWEIIPNAVSAGLQYASLSWPTEHGWVNYNSLQVLAYFVTIFVAAPLAVITGFRMSPLWPDKWERLSRIYPVEVARAVHFPVMIYFVLFIVVHVVLVLATGALRNLNHMFWGSDDPGSWAGFWMCLLGIAAIVGGVIAVRPFLMTQVASVFGKVGR